LQLQNSTQKGEERKKKCPVRGNKVFYLATTMKSKPYVARNKKYS
jgi:hypothetical protein